MGSWQFTPYILIYLLSVILSFSLFLVVIRTKPVKGKNFFALMLLAIGIWNLGYMLEFFNTSLPFKIAMLKIKYFGVISTPILWLFFVSFYTNQDKWLTIKMRTIITIPCLITFLQVLFIEHHDFFYSHFDLKMFDGLVVTDQIYGPGFFIWTFYSYSIVIAGILILVRGMLKMPEKFHGQIILHVVVLSTVLIPNAFYISKLNPFHPYDPICISLVIISVIYLYIMRRHGFLDIVPVAHNLVFKYVKNGVLVTDSSLKILDANPKAIEIFKKNINELIGKHINEVSSMFDKILHKIKANEEFITEVSTLDESHIYEMQSTILADNKGGEIGRIIMLYDVTARKQALKELNAYAHTVAHNLKTPMVSLCGFVDILQEEESSPEEVREFLGYIGESSYKMHSIIDGLLLLAKIRNNSEIETSTLDMNQVIDQVLTRLKHTISKYNGDIISPKKWPDALGVPLWVEEIWINYITNALKYGGSPPVIELGADKFENSIKFWVKDNGEGINPDKQRELFQEFTQLENRKSTEGYGLGLSIVKRIANRLNGDVGIESNKDEGSVFYFILPSDKYKGISF